MPARCRPRWGSTRRSRSWRWPRGWPITCSTRRRPPTSRRPSASPSHGWASRTSRLRRRAHGDSLPRVQIEDAIRTRRTIKAYDPTPVASEVLDELFELARWAPNHNLTNPWRFRVLGPDALTRLKQAAGPEAAPKLDLAPTLVAVSAVLSGDPVGDEEDLIAASLAAYIVLLGAHGRGLAGYWRTPAVLRTPEGREALGVQPGEHLIGLLYLGTARQEQRVPEREPAEAVVSWLD